MVIIVFSYLVEELIDAKLNQPLNTFIKWATHLKAVADSVIL